MSIAKFIYQNVSTLIQYKGDDKFKDICIKFGIKTRKDINNLFFIYNGNLINNLELKLNEIENKNDIKNKQMIILVYDLNKIEENTENKENKNLIKSEEVICPICGESIKVKLIIEDFEIKLYECKNNHEKILTFDEFEKNQYIDQSKIICNKCKENNKSNTYGNKFYKCNSCKINLCPICKENHDKSHSIIDYNLRNYICQQHNERYIAYCNDCKINICGLCEHEGHKTEYYKKPNIEDKKEEIKNLRNAYDLIFENIKISKFYKKNLEKYYNICKNIINNYDIKNRNYENIQNINHIINNDIIRYIINILNRPNCVGEELFLGSMKYSQYLNNQKKKRNKMPLSRKIL